MANPYRGEAELNLAGKLYTLRLTLGALAELEAAFGAEDLGALGERLGAGKLAARDVIRLLAPLLSAGGTRLAAGEIGAMIAPADLPEVMRAIAACFAAAVPETPSPP